MCWLCANPDTPAVKYVCEPIGGTFEGPSGGGDTIGSTIGAGNLGALAVGGTASGVVDVSGDQDLFAITVTAGQTIRFNLDGAAYNGATACNDTTLALLNASGAQIAYNDDANGGYFSQITYTFNTAGTYYLRAQGYGTTTGGYQLSATQVATPPALPVYTIPQISDQITNGYWTYSGGGARRWGAGNTDITYNVAGLTAERATLARLAFATWADVCGLTFSETSGTAEITLDDNDSGAYANSTVSGGIISSSAINVATSWFGGSSAIDSYTLQTYIHEIGHTLGLGHGGNYNGSATYGVNNHYQNDTWQYTIMSYMEQANYGGATTRYVFTPQMADIYAVQALYGASTAHAGNTTYGFNVSGLTGLTATLYNFANFTTAPAITIFDASGIDTLDVSGYTNNQRISLVAGTWSDVGGLFGNIGIALTAVIENAVGGSGNDTIIGNDVANVLRGGAGNDAMDGGAGDDVIYYDASDTASGILGGLGFDTLFVDGFAAPTGFNLAAQGFEQASRIVRDTGANWWANYTDFFDTGWRQTARNWLADDNRTINTTFDTGNNWWAQLSDYRNASGTLTNQDGVGDTGGTFSKAFDYATGTAVDGVADWLREYTYFFRNATDQANGTVQNVEGFADDGRKFTQTNDIDNNQAWTTLTTWYRNDGVTLNFQEIHWDNGTTQIIYL